MMQQTTHSSGQQQMVNPMVRLLRDREIGRMAWVMPLTRGITRDPSLKLMLYIGLVALWHGRFRGNRYPRISNAIEQFGVVCFMLSFFRFLLGFYLPPHLVWVCWVCCAVSIVPFIFNFLPTEDRAPENFEARNLP